MSHGLMLPKTVMEPGRLSQMDFAGRRIGPGLRTLVIAEAGVNHNGDVARAHELVDAAAAAGADAVKFQAFQTHWLVTEEAPRAKYQADNTGCNDSQFKMLKALELSAADFASIKKHCDDRGILFLCTPFDTPSADMLAGLGVVAMKIPSGEVTNTMFLRHIARLDLPLILSTGMATLDEIDQAVATLREYHPREDDLPLVVLHCVTSYPAPASQVNLKVMDHLSQRLGVATGLSDHTLGINIAVAAAARGAWVIEKHFTLDQSLPGPDHKASLNPEQMKQLVAGVREVHEALGDGQKQVTEDERATAALVRRSVAAVRPIAKGEVITPAMLTTLRPASGIAPSEADRLLGKRATRDIPLRALLAWEDVD